MSNIDDERLKNSDSFIIRLISSSEYERRFLVDSELQENRVSSRFVIIFRRSQQNRLIRRFSATSTRS